MRQINLKDHNIRYIVSCIGNDFFLFSDLRNDKQKYTVITKNINILGWHPFNVDNNKNISSVAG